MKKSSYIFITIMILVSLVFGGCSQLDQSQESEKTAKTAVPAATTEASDENDNNQNYEDYKGNWKLKVAEDEELYLITSLENYFGATGINITGINNGSAKGSIYSIQGAPSYRQAEVSFEGKIEDGKLTASYEDEGWEYTGNIELTFENGKIEANIIRDEVETTPLWGIPEGKFAFLRPIETETISLSDDEKSNLERFLSPITKDTIKPSNKGELTDDMIINFVGVNIGAGFIDISEFGDKVKESGANVVFEESVMNDLANRYFGANIKEHKSYDIISYEKGIYTVPALGGVSEYPFIQMMMKDTKNDGTYYAIVDYMSENPQDGKQLEYEYLIELHKNDFYTIKSIKEINYPIDFEMLN